MTIDPRTTDEIESNISTELRDRIDALTNFLDASFNAVFLEAFGDELHEVEARLLAAQLSGWADYAGKTITQTDLDQLGVDGVDPEEVNEYMDDSQLDELGELVGIERNQGSKANGQVTVTVASDTTRVPDGMEVSTQPDASGNRLTYFVTLDGDYVTPANGQTTVTVDIVAAEIGTEYNVGAGTITFLPDPPVGVQSVTNQNEVTGGLDVQANESYRNDIKNAVFEAAGGGTVAGVTGAIASNVDGVADVTLDEFVDQQPPFVDVIVDGGSDADVQAEIDDVRPTGIRHNLVRPELINLGVRAELQGTDIDTGIVEDAITDYLVGLSLDDEFRRSQLIQAILNSDSDIEDIGSLSIMVLLISGEREVYSSGTSIYELDFAPLGEVLDEERLYDADQSIYPLLYEGASNPTVEAVVNGDRVTLTQGTDYSLVDNDGDTVVDSIDFSVGGSNPDDGSTVYIAYEHTSATISSTIEDENGNTYNQGTDWALIDNDTDGLNDSIDWSIGGGSPNDGVAYTVDYTPRKTVERDQGATNREKIGAGTRISATASEF